MKVNESWHVCEHVDCILSCSVTAARAMNAKQDNALISSISHQISQYFEIGGKENSEETRT
jgi:hypothetical protein